MPDPVNQKFFSPEGVYAKALRLKVGPQTALQDGDSSYGRADKGGALVTTNTHGFYHESTMRGGVFSLVTPTAVTIGANNVIAAGTNQPVLGLFNPLNSGVRISVIKATVMFLSGTTGDGGMVWGNTQPNTPVTAASGGTEVNMNNFRVGVAGARTFVNSAMTGATASALLSLIGGPTTGLLAANATMTYMDQPDGAIQVLPGATLGIYAFAAGTSPIVLASMLWEEVPLAPN